LAEGSRKAVTQILALTGSLILALITALAVAASTITSNTPYSIYNYGDNGYSVMATKAKVIWSPEELESLNTTKYYLVVPFASEPDNSTLFAITRWLSRGGSLVILDEKGYSNTLLGRVFPDIRVLGTTVYDPYRNSGDRADPYAEIILNNDSYKLCFHTVKQLSIAGNMPNASVIAETSPLAYADTDNDGYYGFGDRLGSYPLVVMVGVNESMLVIIPDSDFLSNKCLAKSLDNLLFLEKLLGRDPALFIGLVNATLGDRLRHAYTSAIGELGLSANQAALLLVAVLAVVVVSRYEA
jgi:hypothetical protein